MAFLLLLAGCGDDVVTPDGGASVAAVTVSPDSLVLVIGESAQLTATLRDSSGATLSGRSVLWSSSDITVATVSQAGLATGVTAGDIEITASSEGIDGSVDLRVVTVRIGSVTVEPDSFALVEGDTVRLTATVRDTAGVLVTDREIQWSTSDSLIAKVDTSGLVDGIEIGTGVITASVDGVTDSALVTVTPATPFDQVSAGLRHVCAVTSNGAAYCWKENEFGQLGDGTTDSSSTPVAVSGGLTFGHLNGGHYHTCGVTSTNGGRCWGNNGSLRLGVLSTGETCSGEPCSTTPRSVFGSIPFAVIAAGASHSCGVSTGGTTYCWGLNSSLQVGNDTTSFTYLPLQVPTGGTLEQLSAYGDHNCGLRADDAVLCWGKNSWGQLGDSTRTTRAAPLVVKGGHAWTMVSAGSEHTCGVATDGLTYCWGQNLYGQLGDGTQTERTAPVPVQGGLTFASVSAGAQHTCAVTEGGMAYCWGEGSSGQLGDGLAEDTTEPVMVAGGLAFRSVSAGFRRTCGVTTLGGLYCWGDNVLTPARVRSP
ncbi:MAG TPA: Ig-like domain-containing protein [Gemmatimonadota bacterium]|nr:Ig-like domain-containing protein [Gemmatimonadota bacterium]